MAAISSVSQDSSKLIINHSNKILSRSLERALDEATYTGELVLNGRKLREFPINKCDLSDTITAGLFI